MAVNKGVLTMGRHDLTLGVALKGQAGLAAGLYAPTPVLTPTGWVPAEALAAGDLVLSPDHGPCPIVAIRIPPRPALWSVLVPAGALDNTQPVILPPGQPVRVATPLALPFTGEAAALIPAAALEGWRGIAPQVPACRESILQLDLSRAALVQAGPGLTLGLNTVTKGPADLMRLLRAPPVSPVMPLQLARHLVAALIAEDTGLALRAAELAQAACDRPAKRA
jgi:hypothetical protein